MCPTTDLTSVRELDHRRTDNIDVALRWDPSSNTVSISVCDERVGETLAFEVNPAEALRAFHHPYAYIGEAREREPVAHSCQNGGTT